MNKIILKCGMHLDTFQIYLLEGIGKATVQDDVNTINVIYSLSVYITKLNYKHLLSKSEGFSSTTIGSKILKYRACMID